MDSTVSLVRDMDHLVFRLLLEEETADSPDLSRVIFDTTQQLLDLKTILSDRHRLSFGSVGVDENVDLRLISLGEISPTQDGDGALLAITHMSSDNNNNQKDLLKVMQNDTDQYHVGGGGGEIDSRHHELAAGPPFFDDHSNNVSNSLFSSSDTLFNNDEDARTIVSTTTNCSSTSSEMEMESVCIKGKLGDMTAKDANQYMIQCKTCSEWYHGSCIGISCTADNTWECDVCALLNLDELCEQGVIEEPLQKKRKYSESHNARGERLYCVCMGVDDGRFMIQCNACSEWYHGACVGISESQADSIEEYECGICEIDSQDLEINPDKKGTCGDCQACDTPGFEILCSACDDLGRSTLPNGTKREVKQQTAQSPPPLPTPPPPESKTILPKTKIRIMFKPLASQLKLSL